MPTITHHDKPRDDHFMKLLEQAMGYSTEGQGFGLILPSDDLENEFFLFVLATMFPELYECDLESETYPSLQYAISPALIGAIGGLEKLKKMFSKFKGLFKRKRKRKGSPPAPGVPSSPGIPLETEFVPRVVYDAKVQELNAIIENQRKQLQAGSSESVNGTSLSDYTADDVIEEIDTEETLRDEVENDIEPRTYPSTLVVI